jgi:ubiquitin-like 1-activating enzyme E1 A
MVDLTDEQAAIYDRQIRIWGAGVQKRLMEARVLVMGCTPLAAEVTKNVVLAGVGNLSLIDSTPAEKMPTTFLSMHSANGFQSGTAADVFAAGLQEMNPMIKVGTLPGASSEVPSRDVIKEFHLVLCFGHHCGFYAMVNDLCRDCNVKFMCATSRGGLVWGFADFLNHSCSLNIDQNAASNRQLELKYIALRDCVKLRWVSMSRNDKRQVNGFLGPWTVIAALEIGEDRFACEGDMLAIVEKGQTILSEQMCPPKFWDGIAVAQYFSGLGDVAPANAVAGGFLANDVVRCVSQAGIPTCNVLLYSIVNNVTQVHNLTGGESAES